MKNKKLVLLLLLKLMLFVGLFIVPVNDAKAEKTPKSRTVSMQKSKVKNRKKKKFKKKKKIKEKNKNRKKLDKKNKKIGKNKKNKKTEKDLNNIEDRNDNKNLDTNNKKSDRNDQSDKQINESYNNVGANSEYMPEVFVGGTGNDVSPKKQEENEPKKDENLPKNQDENKPEKDKDLPGNQDDNKNQEDNPIVKNNDFILVNDNYSSGKNALVFEKGKAVLPDEGLLILKKTGENDGIFHKVKWTGKDLDKVLKGEVGNYVLTVQVEESISINGVDYGKINFDMNIIIE